MLEKNFAIISKRWPQMAKILRQSPGCHFQVINDTPQLTIVIDDIHLTSCYDRQQEAMIQASSLSELTPNIWQYGIGSGDLQCQLLKRPALKKLNVVMLNPSVVLASLSHFDHSAWLTDKRVNLFEGIDKNLGTPLIAIPSCLQLADETSARLRDLVSLELNTPFLNQKHHAESPEIVRQIDANESLVSGDGDVSSLFSSKPGTTIIVAAAGPSLEQSLDWINEFRCDFPLISVNSALKPLMQRGIVPDVAITIDPDPKIISCFQGYSLEAFRSTPMVYFPRVPTQILKLWPGPRLTAYAEHPCYHRMCQKYPRGKLFSSGSVLHSAVDLAVRMGAENIILVGADLAFPGGKKYAQGAGWEEKKVQLKKHWVLDGYGNRVETVASFCGYLRDLEDYIALHPRVTFYNCSKEGAHIRGTHYLDENS